MVRRQLTGTAAALALAALAAGAAGAETPLETAFDDDAGFTAVADAELGDLRGGFAGIAFSLYVGGSWADLGAGGATLPDGVAVENVSPSNVTLSVGLASLPGASGFLQFAEIHGDNNIVNNTMTLNVVIVEGGVADPNAVLAGMGF